VEQSDEGIRTLLLKELGRQSWAPVSPIRSCATAWSSLWGTTTDKRERQALVVAAENVPGVKAVRDQLVWVDATSGMVISSSSEAPVQAIDKKLGARPVMTPST
jgi:hypothetical protein